MTNQQPQRSCKLDKTSLLLSIVVNLQMKSSLKKRKGSLVHGKGKKKQLFKHSKVQAIRNREHLVNKQVNI